MSYMKSLKNDYIFCPDKGKITVKAGLGALIPVGAGFIEEGSSG
ncbi:MAG: hypothetical protein ACMUIM_09025 [bacterium]